MTTPAIKERPILFSAPMVRALLAGTKTQTRRIVNPPPPSVEAVRAIAVNGFHLSDLGTPGMWRVMGPVWAVRKLLESDPVDARARADVGPQWRCPYGVPGDRLWVREAFTHITGNGIRVHYRADGEPTDREGRVLPTEPGLRRWSPSIHMPRSASRILLEVTGIRVQRLQEISEDDARAEGVEPFFARFPEIGREQRITSGELARDAEHRACFAVLWDEINGDRALWKSNPWVWAVTFKRMEPSS